MRKEIWTTVLAFALLVGGCGGNSGGRASGNGVTEQDARQLLEKAVQHTLDGNYSGLCELAASPSICQREVASDLRARVPKAPPTVACAYQLPDEQDPSGRTVVSGGQVLVVQGTDGQEKPFETEVLVFHDGKRLVAQNVIWWSGMGIAQGEPGTPSATASGPSQGKCQ